MANRYENYLPETLREAFIEANHDQEVMSMKEELALLRTVLAGRMKQIQQEEQIDGGVIKDVTLLVDKIGRTQTAMSNHEARMREVIPIKMIPKILHAVVQILKRRITDAKQVEIIADDIMNIPLMYERGEEKKLLG